MRPEGATGTAKSENVSGAKDQVDGVSGPKSRRHVGVLEWIRTRGHRFVRWIVLLFIASLFVPALTKQWNDRKQELQVKEALLTDISTMSADAVYGAVEASRQMPEGDQKAARAVLMGKWLRDRAAIEPRLNVYFEQSDATNHWYGRHRQPNFRDAMFRYLQLACCDAALRQRHLKRLREYLYVAGRPPERSDAEQWRILACGPQEPCSLEASYTAKYRWLGNQLLAQRRTLLVQLLAANGKGFSSGWRDFIGDLNPLG